MRAGRSAVLFLFLVATNVSDAEDWPGFRGPTRQGVSAETDLPLRFSADENIRWKTPIPGEGWSSPIVSGDHVFVTSATDDGASCRVIALDRTSGRVLWNREVFRQKLLRKENRNSYATPTPVTDGKHVFAVFGDGSIAAVDFDGDPVWINRDFPFYGQHGLGASPILYKDLLIMPRDGSSDGPDEKLGWQTPWDRSFLLALDKKTGKTRWKTSRGLSRIAHVTPNVWVDGSGAPQVISGAGDVVQGFDAKTGELLWTSKNIGEGVVPSIVLGDGLAFAASGWGGRESLKAFRLGARGDLGEENLVWEQKKGMPRIPSVLYVDSRIYFVNENGIALSLDAKTGEVLTQKRMKGHYSASPVAADGRLYFTSDEGVTTVTTASPELEILAENALGERVQASMAVSGGNFFLRTEEHIFCIGGAPRAK